MSIPKSDNVLSAQQFNLSDILNYTEPKRPGTFRRILGSVAGTAANAFIPGVGSLLGNLIGGGYAGPSNLLGDSAQFLQFQQQMQAEMRQFETISAILKARHDCAMDAIRNIK
jgi:hypothetical protein